jgi:hypothetical protein
MSEQVTHTPDATTNGVAQAVDTRLTIAMTLPRKVMEANLQTTAELLTFMSRRMKAQAELWDGLGHCTDAAQASEMQRRFFDGVTQDYRDEMTTIVELARRNLNAVTGLMTERRAS